MIEINKSIKRSIIGICLACCIFTHCNGQDNSSRKELEARENEIETLIEFPILSELGLDDAKLLIEVNYLTLDTVIFMNDKKGYVKAIINGKEVSASEKVKFGSVVTLYYGRD